VTSTSVLVLISWIPCIPSTRSWSARGYIKIQISYFVRSRLDRPCCV
jgi:hypothetical protein